MNKKLLYGSKTYKYSLIGLSDDSKLILGKYKYQEAMNNALVLNDYTDIFDFYNFKICDSIMALDLSVKNDISYNDYEESKNKVKS